MIKRFVLFFVLCLLSLSALSQNWAQFGLFKYTQLGGENKVRVDSHNHWLQELGHELLQAADTSAITREQTTLIAQVVSTLSVEAQVMDEKPTVLDSLAQVLLKQLNNQGYWGMPCDKKMDEHQWACNGFVLNALCDYHDLHRNDSVKSAIATLVKSLYVPHVKQLKDYTLKPATSLWSKLKFWNRKGRNWRFSKARGEALCALNGLLHAREVLRDSSLNEVIDAFTVHATHAVKNNRVPIQYRTAALRALVSIAEYRGDHKMANDALANYYGLLRDHLTVNYEIAANDTATSVPGTADAFMLANDLWRYCQDPRLAELAQLIYNNALCSMQTSQGDFTAHNVPSPKHPYLYTVAANDKAGSAQAGKAMASLCRVWMASLADTVYVNNFVTSVGGVKVRGERVAMLQTSKYPGDEKMAQFMTLISSEEVSTLCILIPQWINDVKLKMNEVSDTCTQITSGEYLTLSSNLNQYSSIEITFDYADQNQPWKTAQPYPVHPSVQNPSTDSGSTGVRRVASGVLVLGQPNDSTICLPQHLALQQQRQGRWRVKTGKAVLQQVNHLMKPDALAPKGKCMQVLFPTQK